MTNNKIRVELGLPNVLLEIPEDRYEAGIPVCYKYEAMFKEFITQAARQFPQWTFVQQYNYYIIREHVNQEAGTVEKRYVMDSFDVYDGREELGTLSARYNRNAPCIHIRNSRIYNDIERGSGRETKDIAKALRLTKKFFGVKTLQECVEESLNEVGRSVRYVHSDKLGCFRRSYSNMCDHLSDYIMANIDTFLQVAIDAGANPNNVRDIAEYWEQSKITGEMERCYADKKGMVVYLHGQNYAVTNLDGTLRIYTAEDAPDTLRRKLGLLKLVEDGQCITDAGLRVNDKMYFVMEELF